MIRPRLTQLRIGNFKAFGETQTIPIKPITLIFGANSSGKSSILHSLAYLHELSIVQSYGTGRRSDVHRTQLGGKSIDLGGFAQLVHRTARGAAGPVQWACEIDMSQELDQDGVPFYDEYSAALGGTLSLAVQIGYAKNPPSATDLVDSVHLPVFGVGDEDMLDGMCGTSSTAEERFDQLKQEEAHYLSRLKEEAEKAASTYRVQPFLDPGVTGIDVQIDGSRLCLLEHESTEFEGATSAFKIVEWNVRHGALTRLMDLDTSLNPEKLWASIQQAQPAVALVSGCSRIKLERGRRGLRRRGGPVDDEEAYRLAAERFWDYAEEVLRLVDEIIHVNISRLHYLGPLRSLPARLFSPGEQQDPDWRASGRDAWDRLIESDELRGRVNDWLGESKLAAKFRLDIEHLVSLEQLEGRLISKFAPALPNLPTIEEREQQLFRELMEIRHARKAEANKAPPGPATEAELWEEMRLQDMVAGFEYDEARLEARQFIRHIRHSPIPKLPQLLLRSTSRGPSVTHRDVGVGISQVLPVLVAALGSSEKTLLMEQPELHLHPRLQTELGDVLIESALNLDNTLILETHSEHLILRIMRRIKEAHAGKDNGLPPITPNDVCILYVEPQGDQSIVREMPLNARGELAKGWPGGFFEEGLREQFGDD